MGLLFAFALKSSFCLAVFYLFYRLLMSRDTFHRFNRITLLGFLTASLLIPLCTVSSTAIETSVPIGNATELPVVMPVVTPAVLAGHVPEITEPTPSFWIPALLFFYGAGILFFMGRLLYSLKRMIRLLHSGSRRKIEPGIFLIMHSRNDIAPFSWFRYVVIPEQVYLENGPEVLAHELAHIRNRHSFDILIADLCLFLQWFNPAAWLLKQELVNIHEYEADESVLKEGINAKNYQLLLIKKAAGPRLYSMANSFNHSNLKKRIAMMLKEKTNPWMRLKYVCVLPLAVITVSALARPEVSHSLENVSSARVTDLFYPSAKNDSTFTEVSLTDMQLTNHESGQKLNDSTDTGATYHISLQKEKVVSTDSSSFFIRGKGVFGSSKKEMILVDGEKVKNLDSVDAEQVASFVVLNDSTATQIFGNEGKNGVILVTTKAYNNANTPALFNHISIKEKSDSTKPASFSIRGVGTFSSSNNAMILVDGEKVKSLDSVDAEQVASFSILKDSTAIQIYGNEGKNGVILVTTKAFEKTNSSTLITTDTTSVKIVTTFTKENPE